jgi:hypothetical protein
LPMGLRCECGDDLLFNACRLDLESKSILPALQAKS